MCDIQKFEIISGMKGTLSFDFKLKRHLINFGHDVTSKFPQLHKSFNRRPNYRFISKRGKRVGANQFHFL